MRMCTRPAAHRYPVLEPPYELLQYRYSYQLLRNLLTLCRAPPGTRFPRSLAREGGGLEATRQPRKLTRHRYMRERVLADTIGQRRCKGTTSTSSSLFLCSFAHGRHTTAPLFRQCSNTSPPPAHVHDNHQSSGKKSLSADRRRRTLSRNRRSDSPTLVRSLIGSETPNTAKVKRSGCSRFRSGWLRDGTGSSGSSVVVRGCCAK